MLEIVKFREDTQDLVRGLELRNLEDVEGIVTKVQEIDKERRHILTQVEGLRKESNDIAKSIGQLMGAGKKEEAEAAKAQTATLKQQVKDTEAQLEVLATEQKNILLNLPNVPHESVPAGKGPDDNTVIRKNGIMPKLPEVVKPHWDLCVDHDIVDWELGAKITGSGFPVYKGKGARLLRGLVQFFLDEGDKAGYTEVIPPLVVNEASGYGTGQLPDKEGQMYHVQNENLYLIPTAEVPITNMFRDVIVDGATLPIRNCGYTPCFRREAGAHGKDVRGLNRLHQFDKVEIVEIAHPDTSYDRLEEMLKHASGLLDQLGLPYRVLLLCGGDMGFTSAKTYDLEVWSGAQERWLEVSSVSNFETYQANRLKLRFRDEDGKTRLAHTLNGSALALPRVMAALMENNQNADGSINIPACLQHYTGFDKIG